MHGCCLATRQMLMPPVCNDAKLRRCVWSETCPAQRSRDLVEVGGIASPVLTEPSLNHCCGFLERGKPIQGPIDADVLRNDGYVTGRFFIDKLLGSKCPVVARPLALQYLRTRA